MHVCAVSESGRFRRTPPSTARASPRTAGSGTSVEQELARNTALQIGYVGNTGVHLTSMQDLNAVLAVELFARGFPGEAVRNEPCVRHSTSGRSVGLRERVMPTTTRCRPCSALNSVPQRSRLPTPGRIPSATWKKTIRPAAPTRRSRRSRAIPRSRQRQHQHQPSEYLRGKRGLLSAEVCRLQQLRQANRGRLGGQQDRRRGPCQLFDGFRERGYTDSFNIGADQSAHRYRLSPAINRPLVTGRSCNRG